MNSLGSVIRRPNILPIEQQFYNNENYFLITQYCQGGNLREEIMRNGGKGLSQDVNS